MQVSKKQTIPPQPHRRTDIDFLRVAAIVAVVVIHVIAVSVSSRPHGSSSWILGDLIDSFMRWCVPVFVMISGALLIKESSFTRMSDFFKKRFNRILIPIIAWPILYCMWWMAVMGRDVPWHQFVYAYLTGSPIIGYHLYFLFLIAGLYALTPFISLYVSAASRRQVWLTTLAILAITTTWYTLEQLIPGHRISYNLFTQGLPYIGYFMLGYLLKDFQVKSPVLPIVIFILGSMSIALLTLIVRIPHNPFFFYSYPGILVMIISPAALLTGQIVYDKLADLMKTRRAVFDHLIHHLSQASFGVYLVHIMVLQTLAAELSLDRASVKTALLILPVTLILSWAITVALLRIPKLRLLLG